MLAFKVTSEYLKVPSASEAPLTDKEKTVNEFQLMKTLM